MMCRRRLSAKRRQAGAPRFDLLNPGGLATPRHVEKGSAGTLGEKSESATMTQTETATATLPRSYQGEFAQAVIPQAAQPEE
ncbi:hypothetical protein FRC01_013451, partial [Tulasnella sp. 417]